MRKYLSMIYFIIVCVVLTSCSMVDSILKNTNSSEASPLEVLETAGGIDTVANNLGQAEVESKTSNENKDAEKVNHMTEREFSFDASKDFKYTGNDKILEVITSQMVTEANKYFGGQGAVEIPTPYVVKIDDTDASDVKVYGNFYIYGYELYGTIFHMKNGGAFPGCYHLKIDGDEYTYIKHEIAEDGSNNYESLLKICGGDEELTKAVFNVANEEDDATRIKYVKMYRDANNLRISGIKDYGWPVILFDDISNAVFGYNFYRAYFDEFRQEDSLNDFVERLENLKKKYMTSECIVDVDKRTEEVGADMVINAQDVTDEMLDTLEATDIGPGRVLISYEAGREEPTKIELTLKKMGATVKIVSMK